MIRSAPFWSKVKKTENCWLWTGALQNGGYGVFRVGSRLQLAHRVAYKLSCGVPLTQQVLHTCDVRSCINPGHLYQGTQKQNIRDMFSRKRKSEAGVKNPNHKLNDFQVKFIRTQIILGTPLVNLAQRFQVHASTISRIKSNERWRNV